MNSAIYDDWHLNCRKHQYCNFTMSNYVKYDEGILNKHCTTNPGKIYLQYKCLQTDGEMNNKREQAMFISCTACFVAIMFLVIIWYLQKVNDIDFQKWDIDNLTSSDFTIEY